MRLLIVTQTVDLNDPVLGFFHAWIAKLAGECSHVEVICLKEGAHALPGNVQVHSLGKERGASPSFVYGLRFYRRLWQLRGAYDAVLVHMNPEYAVLAGWLWRLAGKRVVLWYVHKSVDLKLRIAAVFADAIATTSPESLRLATRKAHIVGHGIDVESFPPGRTLSPGAPRFLSAGRISGTKNQLLIISAFKLIQQSIPGATLTIAGAPATAADRAYEVRVREAARALSGAVVLAGPVKPEDMPALYGSHDVLLHASDTGSLDKVVLEALASGMRAVSSSEAFVDSTLPVMRSAPNAEALAQAAHKSLTLAWDAKAARRRVAHEHDLSRLIEKLSSLLMGERVV